MASQLTITCTCQTCNCLYLLRVHVFAITSQMKAKQPAVPLQKLLVQPAVPLQKLPVLKQEQQQVTN